MAGFLRKKKQDPAPISSPARAPSSPANTGNASPIFARFATTAAVDSPSQRVVSSPMALATTSRNVHAPRSAAAGGIRGAIQHQEDAKQPRQTAGPFYVQTNTPGSSSSSAASASISNALSYGSPTKNRLSSPPPRTQTLPAPAASAPPPNRRFSLAPADKPLPAINPQANYPDPLGSPPPQSSLPGNRRTSRGGVPSQASVATQNLPNGRAIGAPVQQPHIAKSPSNASPRPAARTPLPGSSQAHSANTISEDPSRYPKEYARQGVRHKLSNASTASGGPSAVPAPASSARQSATGQWGSDGRVPLPAPAAYQVNLSSLFNFSFHIAVRLRMDPAIAS